MRLVLFLRFALDVCEALAYGAVVMSTTCPQCGHQFTDPATQANGAKRWDGTTKAQRSEAAKKAAKARWMQRAVGMVRAWLATPPGNWPETVQAYQQAEEAMPDGVKVRDLVFYVPKRDWHPDRRG